MLNIFLCFISVLLTAFFIGFSIQNILFKIFMVDATKQRVIYSILLGIIALTVYAQIISLFCAVTYVWAFIAMVVAILLAVLFSKKIFHQMKSSCLKVKWYEWILFSMIFALIIVATNAIPLQYDNYLYQAQSIRFYEEYGVIKGLANISSRLGFNSSVAALMALFSFKGIVGQSLHTINAIFAFIAVIYVIHRICHFREKRYHVSDALGAALLLYLFKNIDSLSCVGTDMPALIFASFSVMIYASLIEEKEKDTTLYGVVALIIVYTISIKLSMVMLILIVIHPVFYMIKNKEWKKVIIFLLCGVTILLPFLVRNVIISGWLIYPFTAIDLFQVSWKVPYDTLVSEAEWIYSWARIPGGEFVGNAPMGKWFPTWWLNGSEEVHDYFLCSSFIFAVEFIKAIYGLIKKKTEIIKWLLLKFMFFAGFIYWLFSAPDVRFGWFFLVSIPFIFIPSSYFLHLFKEKLVNKVQIYKIFYICIQLIISFYIVKNFIKLDVSNIFLDNLADCHSNNELWIQQQDYIKLDVDGYNIGEVTFYYSESSDQTGYYGFPGVTSRQYCEMIELMGDSLGDGVKRK